MIKLSGFKRQQYLSTAWS